MSEWVVVTSIVVLIGLVTAIVTPIVKLNTTITKLTVVVDTTQDTLKKLTEDNTASHRRLWERNDEQGEQIQEHEKRITALEIKRRGD